MLASDGTLKYEPKYNLIYRADMPKADIGSRSSRGPARAMSRPTRYDREYRHARRRVPQQPSRVRRWSSSPRRPSSWTRRPACSTSSTTTPATARRGRWRRRYCEAEGQKIGYLLVNDDVAVKDSTWTIGRRGVAGNFFVIKAVAAKADKGGTLEECVAVGEKVIANVRTMGVALSSCTPPVRGTPLFEIADGEMEVGIGIHGEPGRERRPAGTAARSWTCSSTPSCPTFRSRTATRSPSWSTASAGPDHGALSPLRHR